MAEKKYSAMLPVDEAQDIQRVAGYSTIMAATPKEGANYGTTIRRFVLKHKEDETFADFSLVYSDVAFLVSAISTTLRNDARMMANFRNFELLTTDIGIEELIGYLDNTVKSAIEAKDIIQNISKNIVTSKKSDVPDTED